METKEKEEKKTEEKTNVQFAGFRVEDGAEMKACRYCKVMVPKKAWICPNCKMKIRRHWGRWIAVVLVLAVLAGGTAFLALTERGNAVMASVGILTETKKQETKAIEASAKPEIKETESAEASAELETKETERAEVSAESETKEAESTEVSAKPETKETESTEASAKPETKEAENAQASAELETESTEASAGLLPEFGNELLFSELTGEAPEEAAAKPEAETDREEKSEKEEKSKREEKSEDKKQQKETTSEETADEDAENEEGFRSQCEVVDYRMLMRSPEEYEGQNLTVTAEILELVDGGLFDDQIYYLAVAEDEKGIQRYYILRDDRGEDALPLFEGDEICIYGQLFDTCELKGRWEIDREVPAVSILFLDLL